MLFAAPRYEISAVDQAQSVRGRMATDWKRPRHLDGAQTMVEEQGFRGTFDDNRTVVCLRKPSNPECDTVLLAYIYAIATVMYRRSDV